MTDSDSYRPREYETEDGPWDPISGGASALLGTIASLTMGIADFPIELFRSVKHKHQNSFKIESSKENTATNTSSGSDTPPLTSRSTSQLDLALADEKLDPLSPLSPDAPPSALSEASSHHGTASTASAKTSYESTDRSSTDRSTDTPLTSTASLGSPGEHRGSSLKQALRGTLSRSRSNSRNRSQGTLGRSNTT
jgi:hypothetical protein